MSPQNIQYGPKLDANPEKAENIRKYQYTLVQNAVIMTNSYNDP